MVFPWKRSPKVSFLLQSILSSWIFEEIKGEYEKNEIFFKVGKGGGEEGVVEWGFEEEGLIFKFLKKGLRFFQLEFMIMIGDFNVFFMIVIEKMTIFLLVPQFSLFLMIVIRARV